MLDIRKIDHVGIRVSDKHRVIEFYGQMGFQFISDGGFEGGHPVIMRHPGGLVINLLGPAIPPTGANILMDVAEKHPGITHFALRVDSIAFTRAFFEERKIEITGAFSFKDLLAIFVRDPDGNVIEFDEYAGEEPETRRDHLAYGEGYPEHS